jgi:preprotein translocase SecE subunit
MLDALAYGYCRLFYLQMGADMADKPAKPSKRRVKNPETFRERALKASQEAEKPQRASKVKEAGGKLTAPMRSTVGKAASSKQLRPVRKVSSPIGKVLLPPYIRNSWRELQLVTWPDWKQSRKLTLAVLIFAIIFGALIAVVDYGLDKLFREILLK